MKHKDFEAYPERSVIKKTIAEAGTYYPDLNLASVFRIVASGYATVIGTPKNPRDGQYLRLEMTSADSTALNFSTVFHVNGAVIADGTHTGNDLLILEGWYDGDNSVWNMHILGVKAA